MKVGFQGEIGAYSEEAARELVPNANLVPLPTFDAVFKAITNGAVDLGIVPIENSLHGSVHENYDLLRENDLMIVGELHLRIRHQFLAVQGATFAGISQVYSHPQAIGQCRDFLRTRLPNAEVVAAYDTAGAARMIAEDGDRSKAAIASARAGTRYELVALADSIESNHRNFTRFLALSRSDVIHSSPFVSQSDVDAAGNDLKTSLVYAQKENVPGSLFKSLAVFALRDIDLYKIESRPLVGSPGKYLFYLDIAGSYEDEAVKNALVHLKEVAASVRILGSYHAGRVVE